MRRTQTRPSSWRRLDDLSQDNGPGASAADPLRQRPQRWSPGAHAFRKNRYLRGFLPTPLEMRISVSEKFQNSAVVGQKFFLTKKVGLIRVWQPLPRGRVALQLSTGADPQAVLSGVNVASWQRSRGFSLSTD